MAEVQVECFEVVEEALESSGFCGLALKGADLAVDLFHDVLDSDEVGFGVFQFAEGFFFLGFVFCDAGCFFEYGATVFGVAAEDLVNFSLFHDGVGVASDPGIHEEFLNVAQAAGGFVQEVFAFSVTKDTTGDLDFVPFDAEVFFAVC